MAKVLEVRIKLEDDIPDSDVNAIGEHLQEVMPIECDIAAGVEPLDVTFEIKKGQ